MKRRVLPFFGAVLLFVHGRAIGAVHYVDLNSTSPAPPYTTWATAATVIQDAVNASSSGDQVIVTNGVYATGSNAFWGVRAAADRPILLRSVNGPQVTTIQGATNLGCLFVTNGATCGGFTLTGGYASAGGGAYCLGVLSNCIVVSNSAAYLGGGVYAEYQAYPYLSTSSTAN